MWGWEAYTLGKQFWITTHKETKHESPLLQNLYLLHFLPKWEARCSTDKYMKYNENRKELENAKGFAFEVRHFKTDLSWELNTHVLETVTNYICLTNLIFLGNVWGRLALRYVTEVTASVGVILPTLEHSSEKTDSLRLNFLWLISMCSKQMENVKGPISTWEEGVFQQSGFFSPVSQLNHLWNGQCSIFHSVGGSKAIPSGGGCFGSAMDNVLSSSTT